MFKGQSPKNFRSKLIIYSNTMTPEDTWGCSTLHSCLPTSKTHQREIQSADCLLIGNVGFICLASGWALTAKSRQGSNDTGLGRAGEPALEQLVALEIHRLEEKSGDSDEEPVEGQWKVRRQEQWSSFWERRVISATYCCLSLVLKLRARHG